MDENLMAEWIQLCLRPYTESKPAICVLDSFRGHITPAVKAAMRKCNAVPAVIPGGCTSILQPLDISINKPFKGHIKNLWMQYMFDNSDSACIKTASKQQIVDWIVQGVQSINAASRLLDSAQN